MAPWIIDRLPPHTHFVESCAGSAAVLALKPPVEYETVNDIYEEVVNFFRVLQDPQLAVALIDRVAFTSYAYAEFQRAAVSTLDPLDRAWGFFVRMQMAVVPGRSGWSYGVAGLAGKKANKPGRWATMPTHLQAVATRFERVQITAWPIEELLARIDAPGVLHFVDPPYLYESRPSSHSTYVCDEFDHPAFVAAVAQTKHAEIWVSHYQHPFYDQGPWEIVGDFVSHRNIANGRTRSEAVERLYRFRR
jgi:DNA adenine methylase